MKHFQLNTGFVNKLYLLSNTFGNIVDQFAFVAI